MNKIIVDKDNAHIFMTGAKEFKKKVTTKAIRMKGLFTVRTSEGLLVCSDGWLAMDARGYPYPIDDSEFQLIYDEVK